MSLHQPYAIHGLLPAVRTSTSRSPATTAPPGRPPPSTRTPEYGQGTAVLANPTDATKLGVLWRTFGTPASLVFKSTTKNAKNIDLFTNDPQGPYRAFDRSPQPIVVPGTNPPVDDKNRVAFRSLAFPWGAYTPDGSVLVVVFTEWVNLQTGLPSTTGMPLIVMKVLDDHGAMWSPRYVLNWQNGEQATVPAAPERLGFFSPARAVGAQFQPAIACALGNVCAVVWKQAYQSQLNPGGPREPGVLRHRRIRPPIRRARGHTSSSRTVLFLACLRASRCHATGTGNRGQRTSLAMSTTPISGSTK